MRALRTHELAPQRRKRPLKDVLAEVLQGRPAEPAHAQARVHGSGGREGMHGRPVPAGAFPDLSPEELETRIDALRRFV